MTKPIARDPIYRRRRFESEIIELCVRWYITYRLSYRDLVAMMAERGMSVSHTTILRWVIRFVPEFEMRWSRWARAVNGSWRVDETYLGVRGKWHYLYRAVDKHGKTVDFLLRPDRGTSAAQAFFRKALSGQRIRFTDAERRRLARKAVALGRKALNELQTLVTPGTLMRWHRELVARKWDYSHRRGPGRPRTMNTIVDLILCMALENRSWGYTRIRGALANLGHEVGRGTIANVLREHGIEPAPERDRHTRWSTFLKAHWESLTATDFLSVEVHTLKGLVTHYVLFFIDIASRSVHIAGITPYPDNRWMAQIARNLTDDESGFLRDTKYLLLDRDTKFSSEFRSALGREGIHIVRLPARSPNLNAFAERFVRFIKSECLSRMIFFGKDSLQHAIRQFMAHYHAERNHQGMENRLLRCAPAAAPSLSLHRRQRLGGMLSYYYRAAA